MIKEVVVTLEVAGAMMVMVVVMVEVMVVAIVVMMVVMVVIVVLVLALLLFEVVVGDLILRMLIVHWI